MHEDSPFSYFCLSIFLRTRVLLLSHGSRIHSIWVIRDVLFFLPNMYFPIHQIIRLRFCQLFNKKYRLSLGHEMWVVFHFLPWFCRLVLLILKILLTLPPFSSFPLAQRTLLRTTIYYTTESLPLFFPFVLATIN